MKNFGTACIDVVASPNGPALRIAEPANKTIATRLAAAGLPLSTRCGGRGTCHGCQVRLLRGAITGPGGETVHAPAEIQACQARTLEDDIVIAVPARSRLNDRPHIATTYRVRVPSTHQPLIEPRPGADLGLAIDVGTTTVVVQLVALADGTILAQASGLNRQCDFGADVLTRIERSAHPAARRELQEALTRRTLRPLIAAACREAGRMMSQIAVATVAGNTTMLHLLAGEDPTSLGVAPFTPVFLAARQLTALELGLAACAGDTDAQFGMRDEVRFHLLPGLSAYVGADLMAGLFCTGLAYDEGPSALLDIGTNGEILLRSAGRLHGCATAAGPAFEGGRLSFGSGAVAGAICRLRRLDATDGFASERIHGVNAPVGLCGTAYIDFLALARSAGWLTPAGRFCDSIPPAALGAGNFGKELRLVHDEPDAVVSEADVAQLLQAKAAIAAGLLTLLHRVGLAPADLKRLYVAGGFGLHLDIPHAIACGLLPGFRREQIEVVGNTALGGAWLALMDRALWPEMAAAAVDVEIVELNLDPNFEDTFLDQLALT